LYIESIAVVTSSSNVLFYIEQYPYYGGYATPPQQQYYQQPQQQYPHKQATLSTLTTSPINNPTALMATRLINSTMGLVASTQCPQLVTNIAHLFFSSVASSDSSDSLVAASLPAEGIIQHANPLEVLYGNRKALLVGVRYLESSSELQGSHTDVRELYYFLTQCCGFK